MRNTFSLYEIMKIGMTAPGHAAPVAAPLAAPWRRTTHRGAGRGSILAAMFAHRLAWPNRVNRLAALLEEKRRQGRPILDLTESNPTRVGLDYPVEEIRRAIADPGIAAYEPSARGLSAAREAVAAWHRRRGWVVDPERIVLTASTSEAYALLFKLLADPGETVLVPRPSYPLFDFLAALESVRPVPYPLESDGGWSIDLETLERLAAAQGPGRPRAIVTVNPNNPTGTALRPDELAALEEIAARHDLAVVSDEVFLDYLDDRSTADRSTGTRADRAGSAPHRAVSVLEGEGRALSFVLGGLSKSCGLPQMKLGWIVIRGPQAAAFEALERLELIADTYLSVGAPVQLGAAALLDLGEGIRAQIAARIRHNRAALAAAIGPSSACRLLPSAGGWYAVVQIPAVKSEENTVLALLDQDDVLVHPGYFFDFPHEAFLILSLLPERSTFVEALRRILSRSGAT